MLLLAASALAAPPPPPVVNGATTTDYPEVVWIYAEDRSGYGASCTGSLIADKWVLTAAHCVTSDSSFTIDAIYLFVGSNSDTDLEQQSEAAAWYPHPDYDGRDLYNDVGLIELTTKFRKVDLMPYDDTSLKRADIGTDFRIVGWGQTSDNDNSQTAKKRYADVPLNTYDSDLMVTYDGTTGKNACHGDSGGPVLQLRSDGGYAIAGIVNSAYGSGVDCEGNGLASAVVKSYVSWIEGYTDIQTWDELNGSSDADTDTDSDSDADSDSDTDADADSDADADADADADSDADSDSDADADDGAEDDGAAFNDPKRPNEVGEDYGSVSGCGCLTSPESSTGGSVLLLTMGMALAGRRRR